MNRRIWIPGLLVCAAAVTGCGLVQPDVAELQRQAESEAAGEQENADSKQDTAGSGEQSPAAEPADASQASTTDASKVIAKAVHKAPFAEKATVEIAVHSLKRRGKLADLVISLTPRVPEGVQVRREAQPLRDPAGTVFRVT